MSKEAMKLALDGKSLYDITGSITDIDKCIIHRFDLIQALAALAKQEQGEPVALDEKIKTLISEGCSQVSIAMQLGGAVGSSKYNKMFLQLEKYFEEQEEPAAWGFQNTAITGSNRWMMLREEVPANDQYNGALWTPLYTTPQQRKPLTREVIDRDFHGRVDFVRQVEAAHEIKG